MNREQFIKMMRDLLDEFERDHEEYTGTPATQRMGFKAWAAEIYSLFLNTRANPSNI